MKQFLKIFTGSCLGTIAGLGFLVLFIFLIAAIVAGGNSEGIQKGVLKLSLDSGVPELTENVSRSPYDLSAERVIGLNDIKDLIQKAATDDNIEGILLNTDFINAGPATLQSIRLAIDSFKRSDKFVYAYADFYGQSGYYLASIADSVLLNTNGGIDLKGYGVSRPYFKDMMDRSGIQMNIFYAGQYKSATEPYRRNSMSPQSKEQTREYLNDLFQVCLEDISDSRNIPLESLENVVRAYEGRTSKLALANGLIDKIAYWDEVEDMIRRKTEKGKNKKINYISLEDYYGQINVLPKKSKYKSDKIAVVYAEGDILYNADGYGRVSEGDYLEILQKIRRSSKVKAVVLRVNSPGGSALTSDLIWREIELIKQSGKPVVASFGDYAASGGYYIACGADTIVSMPNTLTGSIGVFSMFPNVSKLMKDKLGIHFDSLKTHPFASGLSPMFDLGEGEKRFMQEGTDELYSQFLDRVAEGRNATKEQIHEIAQGRVWSGQDALNNGLVDVIGDLEHAIDIASEMADIEKYELSAYPKIKENPWREIMRALEDGDEADMSILKLSDTEKELFNKYQEWSRFLSNSNNMARLPYVVNFD